MNRTILIVDDSKTERVVLNGYLRADYDLIEATGGEEALEILRAQWQSISAVVLDIIMPDMDGYETLKAIKADARWLPIPVIITTGLDDQDSREKAVALGADSFITKPFDRKQLLDAISDALQLREIAARSDQIVRDMLTGLLSRDTFFREAERMIRRRESGYYTLSCVNIENFKVVNDQQGTETGDEVLVHIARTLSDCVGSIKGLCGRYTADKFAVLFPASMRNSDEIEKNHVAVTTPSCVRRPIRIRVGRYLVVDTELPVRTMFDRASMAEEKVRGRYDTYIGEYNEKMRDDLIREQQIVGDMVSALEKGEFEPWFQPQYNHTTGALVGAEALVRWRRDGSIAAPNEFVPFFEKNGFIYEVDKAVWRQVCEHLRRWLDEGKHPVPVSVNISRYDLYQSDFIQTICGYVDEFELPIDLLSLEITESAFSKDTHVITGVVKELIKRGFTVEIDDFGSGYSSLNTLKDVPATVLKLDMRFFETTENSERGGNIVESVVRMAKWLGMAVIAEGVEEKAQADYLKTIGCYYIQGYYYARPMPVYDYEAEMEKNAKEAKLSRLETLETLDSNLFWDPKSMETLIFNSYAGGACIFEVYNDTTELIRMNDQYVDEMHGLVPKGAQLKDSGIVGFIDDEEREVVRNALAMAQKTERAVSCVVRLTDGKQVEYIRYTARMIAKTNERRLYYAVIVNITEQRKAEQNARINAERISAIMDNTKCGITAFIISPKGETTPLFINNRFYELLGYTPEQFSEEVRTPFDRIWPEDRDEAVRKIVRLQEAGQSAAMQIRAICRDGSVIWLRVDITIVKFANVPHPVQLSNFLDITEQVEIEQKREEAAKQLQVIMGNVNGSVSAFVMDETGNTTPIFCNQKYYEIYGYTKEQADEIQLDVMSCVVPEDFAGVIDKLNKLKRDGVPIDVEYRAKKRDGSVIFVRGIASRMSMDGYGDEVIVAVETDCTEQHTLQDQLRAVVDNINGGVSVVHIRNDMPEFLLVNDSYFEIIGYTKEQFYAEVRNAFDIIHPDDRERTAKLFKDSEAEQKHYTIEYRIVRRNGAIRHVLCNTTVMYLFGVEEPVQLAVVNDITTLREAQHKERVVSDRMQAVMQNIEGGVSASVFRDENHVEIVFANEGYYRLFGYTREQFEAEVSNAFDPVLPEDRGKITAALSRIMRERGSETYEYRCRKRDGSVAWMQATSTAISLEGVGDTALLAATTDVTALRRAEKQSVETADRLGAVMNAMKNGITAVTIKGKIQFLFANDCYYKMHDIRRESGTLNTLSDAFSMIHSDDRERVRDVVMGVTDVGQSAETQYKVNLSDGTVRNVKMEITATKLIGVDTPVQVAIYMDITDEKKADEQLRFLNESAGEILAQADSEMAINNTLRKLLAYFAGERSYIFELDDITRTSDNTYELCAAGITPEKEFLQGVSDDTQKKWFDAFDKTGFVAIPDVAAIEDDERDMRELLLAQNIRSIIVAPLWRDGKLIGYIGVDNPAKAVDQVSQLIALSDYIAVLLTRRDLMKEIEHERQTVQQLMDDTPGGFVRMELFEDMNPAIVSVNDGICSMLGMTRAEVMQAYGDNVFACLADEDALAAPDEIAQAYASGKQYTSKCRLRRKDGELFQAMLFGRFVRGEAGKLYLNAYFTDITEQRNIEQLQIDLLDNLPFGAAMFEYDGKSLTALHINKQYIAMVNRKINSTLEGFDPVEAIHPDDRRRVFDEIRISIAKKRNAACDVRLRYSGEEYRSFRLAASIVPKGDGKYVLYVVYERITDLDKELKETSERLKLLSDSIPGGIATFRCMPGDIEIIYYNDGICALTGYSREDFDNSSVSVLNLVFDEDKPVIKKQIELLISGAKALDYSVRIHTKDGGYKWVECMASVTGREGENVFIVSAVLTDVTARHEEHELLRVSEELNRLAIDQSGKIITRYDVADRTLTLPYSLPDIFVLPRVLNDMPEEQVRLGRISPDTADAYRGVFERIGKGEASGEAVYQQNSTLGWRWLKSQFTTIFAGDGRPVSAVVTFEDITEQREKEAIYTRWQNSIAERSKDSYTLFRFNLSKRGSYDSWEGELLNLAFEEGKKTFDERTDEFVNQCVYAEDRDRYRAFIHSDTMLAEYYRGHRTDAIEFREYLSDGKTRWLKLTVDLVEYPDSPDVQAYMMYENIDEQKRAQQSIIERAETDSLTGILNRTTFAERANRIMSESKPDAMHALLMIDIDGFKQVNDVFGHGAGDKALVETADIMTHSSRKEDLVGRLGGDEFVVFIPNIPDETAAAKKARQLCGLIRKNLGMNVRISASIGIALFPHDGEGFESLYKVADSVLYRVKDGGKNGYGFAHDEPVPVASSHEASKSEVKIWDSPRRILIVDDSKVDMDILFGLFRRDFRVEKATNGAMALMKLRHYGTAISVVLLDLRMPDMDGYEVLKKMKQNEATRTIPVIVVSADEQRETALTVIRAGADDLVVKPVDSDILRVRVEAAIHRSENERMRARNSFLSLRNAEINSYKSALERSGIMVISLEWGKNEFGYSPSVSERLAGEYDGKVFWRVLLSNMVTESQTVREMQQLVHDVADNREQTEGGMTVKLKTTSGAASLFDMSVFKEVDDLGLADRIIITLKELT